MSAAGMRYSKLMIALHWTTALVVVIAYVNSRGGPDVRADPPVMHLAFGFAALVLIISRVVARLLGGAPPLVDVGGKWLTLAAKLGHATLYLLLIAVPITGWFVMSRLGLSFSVLGFSVPELTAAVQGRAGIVARLHQLFGNLLLILAALHAAIALWHHFSRHDNTLRRMSPF